MGSVISAIHDDMEEYEDLCRKYGETPHRSPDAYGNLLVDCYGQHARLLKQRQQAEWAAQRARTSPAVRQPVTPKPVVYKNDIGQEIRVGDRVITVAQGYCHSIKTRAGIFVGLSPAGSPQVRVMTKRWNSKKRVHVEAERVSTLPAGRVYKIA